MVSSQGAVCTLPAASAVATGFRVRVKNQSDGLSVTIARAGSDTIDGATGLRVPGRSEIEVTRTGTGEWSVSKLPPHLVGEVIEWTTNSLPAGGWAWCNGVALSRSTHAGLFAEIGATYGAGDGSTTFNPPDRRGRVAAGKGDMGGASDAGRLTATYFGAAGTTLGNTGGSESHTLTVPQMPSHGHNISNKGEGQATQDGTDNTRMRDNAGTLTTDNTGGGSAHNNTQPTIISNFIIKT